jgi:hypothetical protein
VTTSVRPLEACALQQCGASQDKDICLLMLSEPQSGPEISPRAPADDKEESSSSTRSEPEASNSPNSSASNPWTKDSITSLHSIYIAPPTPRLYYRHNSPSCNPPTLRELQTEIKEKTKRYTRRLPLITLYVLLYTRKASRACPNPSF